MSQVKESSAASVIAFYNHLVNDFLAQSTSAHIIGNPPNDNLTDAELKILCEQSLRDCLYSNIKMGNLGLTGCLGVIQAAVQLVNLNQCQFNLPFVLLEDLFECITVAECDCAFSYVENNIDTWRSDTMLAAGKNYLLRMCNNLLRRLSTLRNTVLCGRIQLFLAQLLPLDEKSALNIMGAFNLDNVTFFATDPSVNEENFTSLLDNSLNNTESMETSNEATTEASSKKEPVVAAIDYALYKSFWSLQDYFRNPNQCYDRQKWAPFVANVGAVLKVFTQHKLEKVNVNDYSQSSAQNDANNTNVYFPKNLTSEKLFDLQLADVNFRRHVLVQLLVLFQYLLMKDVKFKPASCQSPPDDMTNWINSTQQKVYALLEESPPNGSLLVKTLKHIISRELIWNSWKNAGCPSFVKSSTGSVPSIADESPASGTAKARTRRVYIGDSMNNLRDDGAPPSKRVNLGSKEMTQLWNIEPDNLKACRAENRRIFPEIKEFFQEAQEQLEPGSGVEEEYLLVLKPNYQWCALRLLARRSTLFFQPNSQLRTVPDFLKAMIEKTYNTKLSISKMDNSSMSVDKTLANGGANSGAATPNRSNAETEKSASNTATGAAGDHDGLHDDVDGEGGGDAIAIETRSPNEEEMGKIAKYTPTENLKDLAVQLDFKDEEIDTLMKEQDWCVCMLKQWIVREGEEASVSNLVQSLLDVELSHIVFRVYPKLLPAQYRKKAMSMVEEKETGGGGRTDEPMTVS